LSSVFVRFSLVAAATAFAAGCVVTTHDGPAEPPKVVRPPPPDPPKTTAPAPTTARQADASAEIGASHILISHRDALQAPAHVTRTKDEARARAEEALGRARAGEAFSELVREYSDEPGAAAREGKLGRFTRQAVVAPFADAAFSLEPGQISNVVETPFGYHIIWRTE
jgi:parvulin-like peptidyl-prolyl isomerase